MYGVNSMYGGMDYDQILQQIMQGNFNLWDILNTAASYVPGLRILLGVLTILFFLGAVIGFLQCFFGYRLFRIFAAIQGFFVGAVLFTAIGAATESGLVTFILFLIGGIGGAILAYRVYQIGVFITTGCYIGLLFMLLAFLALLLARDDNFSVILIAFLFGFVGGGILGVIFSRPLIILSTGLNGFNAVTCLVTALHQNPGKISWILGLLCTIAGIYYQFRQNPPGTLPGPRSKRWEERNAQRAAQGGQRGAQSFANAASAAAGAASSATGNLSKRLAEQEVSKETEELCETVLAYLKKNKIAGAMLPYAHIILYIVTAILFLTNSANLFVLPLALCLLCFAAQRFEAIFISLTLLLLRALPYDFDLLSYGMAEISTWLYFCGVAVIVYLDVLSILTFLKTERGKKFVGRVNNQAEAANLRQQQYAASRQAQPMDQQPTAPVYPETPMYNEPPISESPAEPEQATAVYQGVMEAAEPLQSYGTQPALGRSDWEDEQPTQMMREDEPQREETVSDATVLVPMDAIADQNDGNMSQQVSSDIQKMMDQPSEPKRPIEREYIFCTRCGNRMRSSDNFCTKCGSRLTK